MLRTTLFSALFGLFILLFVAIYKYYFSDVIRTSSFDRIQKVLLQSGPGTVVFLDIDETVITPASKVFRSSSPFRALIDEIKKKKEQFPNFKQIIGNWRKKRKTILVSDEWPATIEELKQKGVKVFALTQMTPGSFGPIPSMEEWRYQEIKSKGVIFTPQVNSRSQIIILTATQENSAPAVFYKGFFMTGPFNKGKVVREFLKFERPSKIIFVDDLEQNILDVKEVCKEEGIPFVGIIYRGAESLKGTPNPEIVKIQREYLIKHATWLEDDEAVTIISSQKRAAQK